MGERRTSSRPLAGPLAAIVAALAVGASACLSGHAVPEALVDGTPARVAGVPFEGVDGPALLAESRRLDSSDARADPKLAACLRASWSNPPAPPFVHRVGISGESVTFADRSSRTLQACDGTGGSATAQAWCGHAFGRLDGGRLRDPRLDLGGCRTSDGRPVAFVWIEPGPGTRYVVVRRTGFAEAYPTHADLPIRVAITENVDLARSSAVVEASEHDADGRRLRALELKAFVSG